jgi:hypothetical protein
MSDSQYPSEEELKTIREWEDYKDYTGLAKFVVSIWNWGEDCARLGELTRDEFGGDYYPLELITGGWSGNEDIVEALHQNMMFRWMCWYSSQRGGRHVYHIKNVSDNEKTND